MKAGSFAAMEFSGGSISSHVCAATGAVGCSPSYLQKTRSLCSGNVFVRAIALTQRRFS